MIGTPWTLDPIFLGSLSKAATTFETRGIGILGSPSGGTEVSDATRTASRMESPPGSALWPRSALGWIALWASDDAVMKGLGTWMGSKLSSWAMTVRRCIRFRPYGPAG
jgi:hypothetical protein